MTFTIINNGKPLGDKVDRNDAAFPNQFPFVAKPTQPFPPGSGSDDKTRRGFQNLHAPKAVTFWANIIDRG